MSLPTIHPLQESPPRWVEEGKCGCNSCRHWSPLISHITAQLDEPGKVLFEELLSHYVHMEMDLGVARAQLAGEWPGWEAMKTFERS